MHIAIIWQRFLPYHWARVRYTNKRLNELGFRFTAIEVASQDVSYGFPENNSNEQLEYICCFPGESYHSHKAKEIYSKVLETLTKLKPDIVFAPAIAFPEGIAALAYRQKSDARAVVMDDAWEHTDRKNFIVKFIRKLIYRNADAVFIPTASHQPYYVGLGFPEDRIFFGVDVVDNEYFSAQAVRARQHEIEIRQSRQLPENYFLFVGRFLPRKGLETLLSAYKKYKEKAAAKTWNFVLVGKGDYINELNKDMQGAHIAGAQFGDALCEYYGLAKVVIVPSDMDPWGLVVNEAMASGLPVIVSKGCGAAKTLVREGENGWTFDPGDVESLSRLMYRITLLSDTTLKRMGQRSKDIINAWTLDSFVNGMMNALKAQRRKSSGIIANSLAKLWKGRVQVT